MGILYDPGPGDPTPLMVWSPPPSPNLSEVPRVTGMGHLSVTIINCHSFGPSCALV